MIGLKGVYVLGNFVNKKVILKYFFNINIIF